MLCIQHSQAADGSMALCCVSMYRCCKAQGNSAGSVVVNLLLLFHVSRTALLWICGNVNLELTEKLQGNVTFTSYTPDLILYRFMVN